VAYYDELNYLTAMLSDNLITEEEFRTAKGRILMKYSSENEPEGNIVNNLNSNVNSLNDVIKNAIPASDSITLGNLQYSSGKDVARSDYEEPYKEYNIGEKANTPIKNEKVKIPSIEDRLLILEEDINNDLNDVVKEIVALERRVEELESGLRMNKTIAIVSSVLATLAILTAFLIPGPAGERGPVGTQGIQGQTGLTGPAGLDGRTPSCEDVKVITGINVYSWSNNIYYDTGYASRCW
jgi:hypothetical protein